MIIRISFITLIGTILFWTLLWVMGWKIHGKLIRRRKTGNEKMKSGIVLAFYFLLAGFVTLVFFIVDHYIRGTI